MFQESWGCVAGCFCLVSQSSDVKSKHKKNSTCYKAIIQFGRLSIANQGKSNIDKNTCKPSFIFADLMSSSKFNISWLQCTCNTWYSISYLILHLDSISVYPTMNWDSNLGCTSTFSSKSKVACILLLPVLLPSPSLLSWSKETLSASLKLSLVAIKELPCQLYEIQDQTWTNLLTLWRWKYNHYTCVHLQEQWILTRALDVCTSSFP